MADPLREKGPESIHAFGQLSYFFQKWCVSNLPPLTNMSDTDLFREGKGVETMYTVEVFEVSIGEFK